ncbi:MAG: hypothetical protein ACLSHP_02610 [Coprococcus sp.]
MENAPIVDRKRKSELGQREKKEAAPITWIGREKERVGAKRERKEESCSIVDKEREKRQGWGKREKKGEDAPIVHRRQRGVLGGK